LTKLRIKTIGRKTQSQICILYLIYNHCVRIMNEKIPGIRDTSLVCFGRKYFDVLGTEVLEKFFFMFGRNLWREMTHYNRGRRHRT